MIPDRGVTGNKVEPLPILEVEDLHMHFPIRGGILRRTVGWIKAVDGVTFTIQPGQTLGLVGESGCGKTTLGHTILQLNRATSGSVRLGGTELTTLSQPMLRNTRRRMQVIFQDPLSSLHPRMTVGEILAEPLEIHGLAFGLTKVKRVHELLLMVNLSPSLVSRYPHELSGGQRQRVGVARALAVEPTLLVCDEAVSALDVSIRGQVVNLLSEIQSRLGIAYLFISHDLGIVRHISTRVAVMYLGKIVELADRDTLYTEAAHPYTQALLSAIPVPDPRVEKTRKRIILKGEIPSPAHPPTGCRFRTRCQYAQEICQMEEPLIRLVHPGHSVACHFAEQLIDHSGKAALLPT